MSRDYGLHGSHKAGQWQSCFLFTKSAKQGSIFFFFFRFFLMWSIFKVLIEFVTILLLLYGLVLRPGSMWDLSFPARD